MSNELSRPANPAPLGLAGFGLTTVVLSCINAGLLTGDSATLTAVVVPLAFAYGGVAQLIAGILEFKNGNTFLIWTVGAGWIKAPAGNAVGLTLLMWGVFTLYMWIPTFRVNVALWSIFLLLWITFFLLAGADFGMGAGWRTAGGWLGLLTGLDALYLSFAEVTNATFDRIVLPVGGPLVKAKARASVAGVR
jgi:succinate-acetate transporter protein